MRPDQNELWERYEDAMFTLLMDEVAHQEGQEQLEWKKQLNDDPSAALPEEVRKKRRTNHPESLCSKKTTLCKTRWLSYVPTHCGCSHASYINGNVCFCSISRDESSCS